MFDKLQSCSFWGEKERFSGIKRVVAMFLAILYTHRKISAHVDGGLSGGSPLRKPGSEDPLGVRGNISICYC